MNNVCVPRYRSATLAPSTRAGSTTNATITSTVTQNVAKSIKYINAVDIQANHGSFTKLTLAGIDFSSSVDQANEKTKFISVSSSPDTTTFSSAVVVPSITLSGGVLNLTTLNATTGTIANITSSGTISAGTLNVTGSLTTGSSITQSAGTASLKSVTTTLLSNSGTLTQTGAAMFSTNITQSAGTTAVKALTVDGYRLYPSITSAVLFGQGIGTGNIEVSVPTWATEVRINFHQLSTYVAKTACTFYIQPGSASGYWSTTTLYCGGLNVFNYSSNTQDGVDLETKGYIPMTQMVVNTSVTNAHFSGYFMMNRMGKYSSEDVWNLGGTWNYHAGLWQFIVCGSVRSQYTNEQLSKIRIVHDSTTQDNQRWNGYYSYTYR